MPNPLVRTSLALHPALAQQVGLVVAEYAVLEQLMFVIYAIASNGEPKECLTKFYSLRSLRRRKALTLTEAKPHIQEPLYSALERLWKRFSAAANRRTEVAHCTYLADNKSAMRLLLTGKRIAFIPLSSSLFERTFGQYHILGTDLLTFTAPICGGSKDRYYRVMNVIPRASNLSIPPKEADSQRPPTARERELLNASLSRLKLPRSLLIWE